MRLLRDSRRFAIVRTGNDRQIVVCPVRPITALAPTAVAATNVTTTGMTVSWTPPAGNPRPITGFRVYANGVPRDVAASPLTLTGLNALTLYRIQVRAVDSAGVEGRASELLEVETLDVIVPPPPPDPEPDPGDTTPPGLVTSLTAAANGATGCRLTFTLPSDVSGILEARIYRDGELLHRAPGDDAVAGVITYDDSNLVPGTTYEYAVIAVDGVGNVGDDATVSYAVPAAATWGAAVIGSPAISGSVTEGVSSVTLACGGNDIWSTADQFRFAYRECTGDFVVTARVASLTNTNEWAKAGVMMRETLSASSRFALMLMTPTAVRGATLHYRTSTGGSAAPSNTQDGVSTLPRYVRLTRVGNVFSGYKSADGVTWTLHNQVTIAMPETILFGLAVTSHAVGSLATAVFDNIAYGALPADVTAPSVPTGLTATAVGSDRIQLSWTASTDAQSGVAGYKVRRGGSIVAPETGTLHTATAFVDTGRSASTQYSYTVSAVDNAGNESSQTSAATATTGADLSAAPQISQPFPAVPFVSGTSGSEEIDLAEHFESPGALTLTYTRTDAGTLTGISLAIVGSTLTVTYSGATANGSLSATIRATDTNARYAELTLVTTVTPASVGGSDLAARTAEYQLLVNAPIGLIQARNWNEFSTTAEMLAANGNDSGRAPKTGEYDIDLTTDSSKVCVGSKSLRIRVFEGAGKQGGAWAEDYQFGTYDWRPWFITWSLEMNDAAVGWVTSSQQLGNKVFNAKQNEGSGQVYACVGPSAITQYNIGNGTGLESLRTLAGSARYLLHNMIDNGGPTSTVAEVLARYGAEKRNLFYGTTESGALSATAAVPLTFNRPGFTANPAFAAGSPRVRAGYKRQYCLYVDPAPPDLYPLNGSGPGGRVARVMGWEADMWTAPKLLVDTKAPDIRSRFNPPLSTAASNARYRRYRAGNYFTDRLPEVGRPTQEYIYGFVVVSRLPPFFFGHGNTPLPYGPYGPPLVIP